MLNQNALTPLYEQLKNAIKDDIHAQIYRPGDRMPRRQSWKKSIR